MRYRWLTVIRDFMKAGMNFIVMISVWLVLNSFLGIGSNLWFMLTLYMVPLVFYFFRKKIESLILFSILHLLVPYLIIMIWPGDTKAKIVTGIVVVVMALMSFVGRLKNSKPGEELIHPTVAAVVMILATSICSYFEQSSYSIWISRLGIVYVIFFFATTYLTNFMWFDFIGRKTITNMPTKRTFKSTFPVTAGFTISAVALIVLVLNDNFMKQVTEFCKRMWYAFLVWIVSLLPVSEEKVLPEYFFTDTSGSEQLEQVIGKGEPSVIWVFLEKILTIAATLFVIFLILFIIYSIIIRIIRGFHPTDKRKVQKISDDAVEVRERIAADKDSEREKVPFITLTISGKIRKLYFKAVLRNEKNESVHPLRMTARNFADTFKDEKHEAALGLAKLYEKARYSASECNKEDLKEARQYAGQI